MAKATTYNDPIIKTLHDYYIAHPATNEEEERAVTDWIHAYVARVIASEKLLYYRELVRIHTKKEREASKQFIKTNGFQVHELPNGGAWCARKTRDGVVMVPINRVSKEEFYQNYYRPIKAARKAEKRKDSSRKS